MKRTAILFVATLFALVAAAAPTLSLAEQKYAPSFVKINDSGYYFAFPEGAIGVTEADFKKLLEAECTAAGCGTFADALLGKTIFRAEAGGQIYRVVEDHGGVGIFRTLPDGFYRAGNTYYWMTNGFKVEIPKGKAFSTMLSTIRATHENRSVTPISEADFALLDIAESGHGFAESQRASVEAGSRLYRRLAGSIIMRVEDQGQLLYVHPLHNDPSAAIEFTGILVSLGTKVDAGRIDSTLAGKKSALFTLIRRTAVRIPADVMTEIPALY